MKNNLKINELVEKSLNKNEIRNLISSELSSNMNSKEFKDKVKEISAKVIEELYKILWTRKGFWSDAIKK